MSLDLSPGLLRGDNLGFMPNDALFHAEATSLMRWARASGGSLQGNGTAYLPPYNVVGGKGIGSAIEVHLMLWAHPELGVLLMYAKYGGGTGETYYSSGDLSRLKEWVRTLYDDLSPVGLYIPLARAWPAIKQFMETDGELPTAIRWIKAQDLPRGTFPDPWDHPEVK